MEMLAESIRNLIAIRAEIKALEAKEAALKKTLTDEHKLQNTDILTEDGYQTKLVSTSRKTLLAAEVEKLLGYEIPATCYKTTTSTKLLATFIENAELITEDNK